MLQCQKSRLIKTAKKVISATEALFKWVKKLLRDLKNKDGIITTITNVQLSANNMARRVSVMSADTLVSVSTDEAPSMKNPYSGFIAHCKVDPDFPKTLKYHFIISQQGICSKVMGFAHVMPPVIRIVKSIRAKANQHPIYNLSLEECSSEYGISPSTTRSDGQVGQNTTGISFLAG
ncbi:unnamed protein product [Lepeophtheirus salmonis]|uniref:(salmon louse) hypothetical protein n=1 Tax=Lepeophtheirus salmonis TaxID=72036 RepID=A0A7R8CY47_LEPSM|nr:unnamed protein product [Lepeophtheirus salmonis]CAF2966825.1 unnamed protein product [Lepeophtheirus salmonis]